MRTRRLRVTLSAVMGLAVAAAQQPGPQQQAQLSGIVTMDAQLVSGARVILVDRNKNTDTYGRYTLSAPPVKPAVANWKSFLSSLIFFKKDK